jgi:TetR/AcrR family transcriptional regulator
MARDPEGTQRRILAAALKEFSAKGFAGARVDRIARRARVNKRMLYHYFGDKQGLLLAVYRRKLGEKTSAVIEQPVRLDASLPFWFEGMAADPDWVRLLAWEALTTGGRGVTPPSEREALYEASLGWARSARSAGAIPGGLEPDLVLLAGFALSMFPLAFPQITRDITGLDPAVPAFRERYATFLRAFAGRLATDDATDR